MKVNVGSWNIWVFGDRDFKGIAKLISKNKIEVIGIQEAAIYYDNDKAEKIAKGLGYHFVFYPAVDFRHREPWVLGNAILSKFPILESSFYQLNPTDVKYEGTSQTEPRILVRAKLKLDKGKVLNFFTTHLQFSMKFKTTPLRISQSENILSVIKGINSDLILTGDFNSVPENLEIKKIESTLNRIGGNEPTWTVHPFEESGWKVDKLQYRLDNIFVSKDLKCDSFEIIKSKISDHLPIKAMINI